MMANNLSEKQKIEIINRYKTGRSIRQLESEFGYNRKFISKLLNEHEVDIRMTNATSRKYHHNEDFFENIDTEQKAYWLGFLYADGFVESKRKNGAQKMGITLSSIDHHHLEKFKNDIEATNPIKQYVGSGYNQDGIFSKILLTSDKTVSDLINKGCFESKTLKLTFPSEDIVPKCLVRHFIRGYFDGDGSIFSTRNKEGYEWYGINFTGTYDMICGINNFLGYPNQAIGERNNAYYTSYGGIYNIGSILYLLYGRDTKTFLDRKFEKVKEFIKFCENRGTIR